MYDRVDSSQDERAELEVLLSGGRAQVDDVLTAGTHYRAMHMLLSQRFPGVQYTRCSSRDEYFRQMKGIRSRLSSLRGLWIDHHQTAEALSKSTEAAELLGRNWQVFPYNDGKVWLYLSIAARPRVP